MKHQRFELHARPRAGAVPRSDHARRGDGAFPSSSATWSRSAPKPCRSAAALGRVLARDVVSGVDVPGFDRSERRWLRRASPPTRTAHAEDKPARVSRSTTKCSSPGRARPRRRRRARRASIATGGMLPRGADAVDHGRAHRRRRATAAIECRNSSPPDRTSPSPEPTSRKGETVLRRGQTLTSREIGVLAAIGVARSRGVSPAARGDRVDGQRDRRAGLRRCAPAPSTTRTPRSSARPCEELGGEPVQLGIVRRRRSRARAALGRGLALRHGASCRAARRRARATCRYRVVSRLGDPGIVAHGVALKPGKPICLAVTARQAGGGPARLPDLGDLHVPRVRRARDLRASPDCRRANAGDGRGDAADARELRTRAAPNISS